MEECEEWWVLAGDWQFNNQELQLSESNNSIPDAADMLRCIEKEDQVHAGLALSMFKGHTIKAMDKFNP